MQIEFTLTHDLKDEALRCIIARYLKKQDLGYDGILERIQYLKDNPDKLESIIRYQLRMHGVCFNPDDDYHWGRCIFKRLCELIDNNDTHLITQEGTFHDD
jgi:hypothetical protein